MTAAKPIHTARSTPRLSARSATVAGELVDRCESIGSMGGGWSVVSVRLAA
jgi:hypothetical protein